MKGFRFIDLGQFIGLKGCKCRNLNFGKVWGKM